jgi:putative hydrolase of the HAD superfamily
VRSVTEISVLFWDVGGVVLSDAWDHADRQAAAEHFGLDPATFERRHAACVEAFEIGQLRLSDYIDRTVFHEPRPFSPEAFRAFMMARSSPKEVPLQLARSLHRDGRYLMATLNNESYDLNEYRIDAFELSECFDAFLSSCYTGHRKPELSAYRFALEVAHRPPEACLFLDDRKENVEAAAGLGIQTVWVQEPARLPEELSRRGVTAGGGASRWSSD